MSNHSYRTKSANEKTIQRAWYVVDAADQTVGRLASQVAHILRGKNKAYYTPHVDCGDYVIIINSAEVKFTGKKMTDKEYLSYTGYPGGQRSITPEKVMLKNPNIILEKAIKGMLPKNKLGADMYRKLFVYQDDQHPHAAQKPTKLELKK